jgi:hypothetical protein
MFLRNIVPLPAVELLGFRHPADDKTFGIQYQRFYGNVLLVSTVT